MSSISPHHILIIITHKKEAVEADTEQSICQAAATLCVAPKFKQKSFSQNKKIHVFYVLKTHDCPLLILRSQNRGCLTGGGVPIFGGTSLVGLASPVGMSDGLWGRRHVNQLIK